MRVQDEPICKPGVLVVDDDLATAVAICSALEGEGYEVLAAFGGDLAWDALQMTTPTPDVLLVDLMMPDGDGWSLVERLREDPGVARIPVVVMTAGGTRLLETVPGAAGHLQKPFGIQALLEALQAALRNTAVPSPGSTN